MKEQIKALEMIQELDNNINEIQRKMNEYPKRISEYKSELQSIKQDIDGVEQSLKEHQAKREQAEAELTNNLETIKRAEGRLMGIKTHREYEALEKEIANTKRANLDIEDDVLQEIEEIEKLETEVSGLRETLNSKEPEYEAEINELTETLGQITNQFEDKEKEKSEMTSQINSEILSTYNRVKSRSDIAVVQALHGACQGCFMDIPPQLYNEVVSGSKLLQCPNCQRILYHQNDKEDQIASG